ncbi:MAG: hypothetical protein O2782_21360 [bacterium]|nr:hypothetical protein [bacterium]
MKPARTTDTPALLVALAEVNGRATAHTASVGDITRWADEAEAKLQALGIRKTDRVGAVCRRESGEKMPSAYSARSRASKCKRTQITMRRRATGWFVTFMTAGECWPQVAPTNMLVLSSQQDEIAVNATRHAYHVAA